jgi:hypothetical protein
VRAKSPARSDCSARALMPRSMPHSIKKVPTSRNVSDGEPEMPGRGSPRCRSSSRVATPPAGCTTNDQMARCGLSGGFSFQHECPSWLAWRTRPKLTWEVAEVPFWRHPDSLSGL